MDDQNDWTSPDNKRDAEIKHLVENTDLSPMQAKKLLAKHGVDRNKLMAAAKTMKAEG